MFEGHQTHRRRQTGEGSRRGSRPEAVVGWTSLGGSLFSDWTYPFTGEPIPRLSSTSLGGSLFSEWTPPVTGEPVPRSSTSFTSTRATQTRACKHRHGDIAAGTRTDTSTQGTQDTSAHATETPIVGRSLDGCGGPRRQVLEVASFVPAHVQNWGATPWSWTALCSKKNKVATPLHSNRMDPRS